ncbi:MAG: sodium:calcium antiporter [Nitrospirae bacterium]|nr:MAG: sodium:calcium antiporter [Nitrospirota bacterium]
MEVGVLVVSLLLIVVGAETFTNALEHLGERLGISEGVTGSIFAAVGTALPEAMVPVVAIFAGSGTLTTRHEVGVGSILGAPLMLSTLTFFLLAVMASLHRGWGSVFTPEPTGLLRDLSWFLLAFLGAVLAVFIPLEWKGVRLAVALGLTLVYFFYLFVTIRASRSLVEQGHGTEADHPLFLNRVGLPAYLVTILLQLGIGLGVIIGGAKGFVFGVEHVASWAGVSTLALSLLIIPVATELPEKVNSLIWVRRGRDTLAFGNITGAMVFQGSLLPALGVLLTPWAPRLEVLLGMTITLIASGYLFMMVRRQALRPYHLLVNGACYGLFVVVVLTM